MNRKRMLTVLLSLLLAAVMTACTSERPVDPSEVEVTLTTEPSPPKANAVIKFTATVGGVPESTKATLAFDIRKSENDTLSYLNAKPEGNAYSAEKELKEPGTYTVYVHLYIGDLHIIKKKKIEVAS
ncbi:FixH family protein [Paenibacillus tyrfis]|uniref:FixH family protein n=1 Tax=Paenibacillus tyrfis TaxID=1501230 RepID=UPI000B58BDE9|nr:FixH family protein [Paenibacillus tyrfis]